jgi:membrane protease YdiL (CAAX protease family)
MNQPPSDPWLTLVALAVLVASATTWSKLFSRWRRGEPLLQYEPRTPVPWGAPLAMLAVVFVVFALLTPDAAPADPAESLHPTEVSQRIVAFIFMQSVVIGGVIVIIALVYKPGVREIGLPMYAEELVRDIRIGIVACLAAVTPIYGVQLMMLALFGPSKHPLVEMVMGGEPNIGVVFLASIAAVIAAPVSEEIFFRLLLQGWLEKWSEQRQISCEVQLQDAEQMTDDQGQMTNNECRMTNEEQSAVPDSSFVIRHSSFTEATAPDDRPHPSGLLPILISSLLFATAHFGYGPDPIAIFFLAIFLGYVYHRTHRIVPCIVAHALFNSLAVFILWRAVFVNVE